MFTIGVDFGTNSVRAIVVQCSNGAEVGAATFDYTAGHQGVLLDANDHLVARQDPQDYVTGLERVVVEALAAASATPDFKAEKVVGVGIDSTGSSPLPVDASNQALGMLARWRGDLNAQCWLWKDHTAWREAKAVTDLARELRPGYLSKIGGVYSSEWWWAKILHCLNVAPEVFDAAHSWVELADWVPSILAGVEDPAKIVRGVCAAGHKAMYSAEWGGLPDKEFLGKLNPKLASLRDRLYEKAYDASHPAGRLSAAWAEKLGLARGLPIAVGAFDVHYGAIGCGVAEGILVKAIGTSTCDCCVVRVDHAIKDIPGICGIVNGSILPGFYGVEAGQSAVGDLLKWWVEVVSEGDESTHAEFAAEAERFRPGQSGLLALDWNNGNRTILVDQLLSGLLIGQSLYTTKAEIYRALIEATAFGARVIIERVRDYGVKVDRIVCAGGIADKNPFFMQIYADATGCAMEIATSNQSFALGSAIVAAVLAGAHPSFVAAQAAMTSVRPRRYEPNAANRPVYDDLYRLYRDLHDAFGGVSRAVDMSHVMKRLLEIKFAQSADAD